MSADTETLSEQNAFKPHSQTGPAVRRPSPELREAQGPGSAENRPEALRWMVMVGRGLPFQDTLPGAVCRGLSLCVRKGAASEGPGRDPFYLGVSKEVGKKGTEPCE